MYERIVVATDTTRPATAVTIASALAADVGALELVTVAPPGTALAVDRIALQRIAIQYGWLPAACTVLPGRDVAATLLRHCARRRAALLVIGSSGHRPLTRPDGGPVTRQLLAEGPDPILVVGPHVDVGFHAHPGKLVLAVDTSEPSTPTLDTVGCWVDTFGSGSTWVIEVVGASDDGDTDADADVTRWVDALRRRDLLASHRVVRGRVVDGIDDMTAGVRNAVVVATSRRCSDGKRHLHSTTRDLIHRGHAPVLVVPDRVTRSCLEGPAESGPMALSS
jgi:nucleotide-binding universal stress UspA family protein